MKAKFFLLGSLALIGTAVSATPSPRQVEVDITKAWVPIGYDDNDNVQVVTSGFFNNTCYKIGPYSTHIDETKKTIHFRQTAYDYGFECLQIMVPFVQIVDLGMLPAGQWQLFDAKGAHSLGVLPIQRSKTAAADDYLYANVTDAYVQAATAPEKAQLVVEGEFTDRCSIMKEIRVHYYPEVIVVQPIMEQLKDRANCGPTRKGFQYKVALQEGIKGTYLLHVRSLSGRAVNKIVPIQ